MAGSHSQPDHVRTAKIDAGLWDAAPSLKEVHCRLSYNGMLIKESSNLESHISCFSYLQ